jgi:hypothetical protein
MPAAIRLLAVRQVHDARDAVLEREPHRDQRIHAAEHDAGQHDIDRKRHDALQIPRRNGAGLKPAVRDHFRTGAVNTDARDRPGHPRSRVHY